MLDHLGPEGRSVALIDNPLEFVGSPCFEQDTRDNDPDGRTGGDAGLDGHTWCTFREHLILEPEDKPITAELPQSTIVLQQHPQEDDTRPVLFDPLHLRDITLLGRGPVVRIHLERQVLPGWERFREA